MSWIEANLALRRGQRALMSGDLRLARERLDFAAASRPKWALPRLWLASVLSETGELEEARSLLELADELSGRAPVVSLWLGRVLIDHRQYQEAVEVLDAVPGGGAGNLYIPGYLALARWCDGANEEVLDELEWKVPEGGSELQGRWLLEIEERFPGGPGHDFPVGPEAPNWPFQKLAKWRADRLRRAARKALTEQDYERALDLIDSADALWLGAPSEQEDRLDAHLGAAEVRIKKLEKSAHDIDLRLAAVEDLIGVGDVRHALELLEPGETHIKSVDENNLSWRATLALLKGRALTFLGEAEDAIEQLELARELWSVEVEPLYYLAIAHLHAGNRARGRAALIATCSMDGGLVVDRLREYHAAVVG